MSRGFSAHLGVWNEKTEGDTVTMGMFTPRFVCPPTLYTHMQLQLPSSRVPLRFQG